MKNIVILGCENSHADSFLNLIKNDPKYSDVNVLGVYSDDKPAMEKLCGKFSVSPMENYDSYVGKVDGIMVTARHGDNHLKYLTPYLSSKQVMFIDKPITCNEHEAQILTEALKKYDIRFTGGSSCKHEKNVLNIKKSVENGEYGEIYGGFVRCPVNLENPYGNFYFYAQHLVEIVFSIFGNKPISVRAFKNGKVITVVFRYNSYDVIGEFVNENYLYSVSVSSEKEGVSNVTLDISNDCFKAEFDAFYDLLCGGESVVTPEDFVSPVYTLCAIDRSLMSGKDEMINV